MYQFISLNVLLYANETTSTFIYFHFCTFGPNNISQVCLKIFTHLHLMTGHLKQSFT